MEAEWMIMDVKEKYKFEEELKEIVKATTKLSFPFFSDKKNKEQIIVNEKKHIDYLIDEILKSYNVTVDMKQYNRDMIWDNARSVAVGKFTTLPASCQMNSFFLQELMHEYAHNQAKIVLNLIAGKG